MSRGLALRTGFNVGWRSGAERSPPPLPTNESPPASIGPGWAPEATDSSGGELLQGRERDRLPFQCARGVCVLPPLIPVSLETEARRARGGEVGEVLK
ncbi:hypothetical protein CRENBAI_016044 [Crenichthys baileyi]|uniref:Uncharacterized protein n=1 Tax=Crenichthys baileyi TaxID=28760 RepID=A0AAV9S0Q2_9TELE